MTDLWDEMPKNIFVPEVRKWLEKLKNVLDSQQKILDELNSHGIIVWDTFIGKWVFPAHLRGLKEKAGKWALFEDFVVTEINTDDGPFLVAKPITVESFVADKMKIEAIMKELKHHQDSRWAVFANETVENIRKILGVEGL